MSFSPCRAAGPACKVSSAQPSSFTAFGKHAVNPSTSISSAWGPMAHVRIPLPLASLALGEQVGLGLVHGIHDKIPLPCAGECRQMASDTAIAARCGGLSWGFPVKQTALSDLHHLMALAFASAPGLGRCPYAKPATNRAVMPETRDLHMAPQPLGIVFMRALPDAAADPKRVTADQHHPRVAATAVLRGSANGAVHGCTAPHALVTDPRLST